MSKKEKETIIQYPNRTDERVAVLENNMIHIKDALEKIDKRFDRIENSIIDLINKQDKRFDKIDNKFDKIETDLKELRNDLTRKIDSRFFWLLTFTIGGFGSLWGTLAHVAHWF